MLYCGIDCGFTGYICFIDKDLKNIILYKMPVIKNEENKSLYDIDTIIDIFTKYKDSVVFIEKQWARPKQSVSSGSKIVYGYGLLMGICSVLNNKVITESPSYWQNFIKNIYFNNIEYLCFRKNTLNYEYLLKNMSESPIKKRFNQLLRMKSIKPSKVESLYLFYKIYSEYPHIIKSINIKNHNIVDAFLMSFVCANADC